MRPDERKLEAPDGGAPRRIVMGWSPGAILPILVWLFLAVLGMLVLIDSGLHVGSLGSRTGTALSFRQSDLLAIVEIGFGIAVVWLAGDSRGTAGPRWCRPGCSVSGSA